MTRFIAAHPVQFVIDTGADVTILSYRVYKELNRLDEIERLTADGVFKGLDGGRTEVVGTATLDFYLGEICVRQQVWIAEIKEDCILGADVLMKQECVIDYPPNVLRIGSTEVLMHANTDELKCLRIVLDRTIKVPGNSEMVISSQMWSNRACCNDKKNQRDDRWENVTTCAENVTTRTLVPCAGG